MYRGLPTIAALALAALSVGVASPAVAEVFALNSGHGPPLATDAQNGFVDTIAREAFARLGHGISIRRVPAERSLRNVNEGLDDGNGPRIAGLTRLYPNIRQVPEAVMTYDFVAFAKNVDFASTDWTTLQPYDAAIIRGWKILEENDVGTRSLIKVRNPEQFFALLMSDRVDVVVFERWEGLHLIQELGLEGVKILEPPLAQRKMYLYLNSRHEQLVPQVAAALRAIKTDGTYQRIHDRILGPFAVN